MTFLWDSKGKLSMFPVGMKNDGDTKGWREMEPPFPLILICQAEETMAKGQKSGIWKSGGQRDFCLTPGCPE